MYYIFYLLSSLFIRKHSYLVSGAFNFQFNYFLKLSDDNENRNGYNDFGSDYIKAYTQITDLMEINQIINPDERDIKKLEYLSKMSNTEKNNVIIQLLDDINEQKLQSSMQDFEIKELKENNDKKLPDIVVDSNMKRTRVTSAQFFQRKVQDQIVSSNNKPNDPFLDYSAVQGTIMSPQQRQSSQLPVRMINYTLDQFIPNGSRIQSVINKQLQKKMISITKFKALQNQIQGYQAVKGVFLIQFEYIHPLKNQYQQLQIQYCFISLMKLYINGENVYFKLQYGDSNKAIQKLTLEQLQLKQLVTLDKNGLIIETQDPTQAVGFW